MSHKVIDWIFCVWSLVRGSVIGPTFHFNIPKLKFGVVSYGKLRGINISSLLLLFVVDIVSFLSQCSPDRHLNDRET